MPGNRKSGELGQTSCAGSRDDEIGRAVNFFHLMMKRGDVSRNIFAAIVVRDQTFITARKDGSPGTAHLARMAVI